MSDETDIHEDHVFEIPLPPHFPPHLGPPRLHARRLMFVRDEDEQSEGGREHEDIMLRKVPRETAMQFRAAAGGRALTHAQYLTALVGLHGRIRELADGGDARLAEELERLGLQTVSI